jgi:hypothetical protein
MSTPKLKNTACFPWRPVPAGAVWLQLANKSMLMNHKLGKRLADACMNPDQIVVAEKMLKNPIPSLLDAATEVAIK